MFMAIGIVLILFFGAAENLAYDMYLKLDGWFSVPAYAIHKFSGLAAFFGCGMVVGSFLVWINRVMP